VATATQDKEIYEQIKMRNIAFGYSTRCNIQCDHCVAAGETPASTKMALILAGEAILKLAKAGVTGISFTAGEPTLYLADITELLKICSSQSIYTRVVTNSLWASDYDTALEKVSLVQESGLKQLRLSYSRWHQEHVPKENIYNAALACQRLGVDYFISFVTDFSSQDEAYEKYLRDNDLKYFPEPLIYSGRAKKYLQERISTDYQDNRCGMNCYLAPDFNMYACCDAGSQFTTTNAFYLGNMQNESPESLFEKYDKNPLFQCIRHMGLSTIASFSGMPSKEITGYRKCELCEKLFNSKEIYSKLQGDIKNLCQHHR